MVVKDTEVIISVTETGWVLNNIDITTVEDLLHNLNQQFVEV